MRKNVGTVDATIRIALGLLGLAYGIGRMSRKPHRTPWLLMSMSAMKVAEGITRFCPMLYALGSNTVTKAGVNAVMENMMEAGGQAAQQVQQVVKGAQETVQEAASSAARKIELSPADREMENEIRDYIASRSPGEKTPSEQYSRDEHLYPTYS